MSCEALFDHSLLDHLDWSKHRAHYRDDISPSNLPPGYKMRPLQSDDFNRGYCDLLSHLTKVGDVTPELYLQQFNQMKESKLHYIVVIHDQESDKVVGSATLVVEHKFIHTAANRGRIEDVIVHPDHQGRQFGKVLLDLLILLAESTNCYKLSLDCNEKARPFYEKLNLENVEDHRFMCIKFFD
ncbi:glucosamine 6-phosphate N-acetyltransferase-like [Bolinopsis microptera]|uniref:glucosamine 6-phosphate N-acetyltransferase-like n=1 Tax=Bolinopsis microptera TaxID=2820187 RepID=UPI003079A47D